jgi:hypothetical protein
MLYGRDVSKNQRFSIYLESAQIEHNAIQCLLVFSTKIL